MSKESEIWYVLCMDDAGVCTFATAGWFATYEDAEQYAKTIAHTRMPMIAYTLKPLGEPK